MIHSNDFYNHRQLPVTSDLAVRLRRSIVARLDAVPHHPYRDLEQELSIQEVVDSPIYLLTMTSQYDRRSVNYYREPYAHQYTPGIIPDFNNLHAIEYPQPDRFEQNNHSYTYPGPKSTCNSCSGRGQKTCQSCSGGKTVTCESCDGGRKQDCGHCQGRWKKYCSACDDNGQVEDTCPSCWGEKYSSPTNPCSGCSGTGKIKKTCEKCSGIKYTLCPHCRYGKVSCSTCGGAGSHSCRGCNGEGHIICGTCSGKGMFIDYAVVRQELFYVRNKPSIINSNSLLSRFDIEVGKSTHLKTLLSLHDSVLPTGLQTGNPGIEKAYQTLQQAHHKVGVNTRLLFQQTFIYRIDCYVLSCQYKTFSFPILVYGSKQQLYDAESPVIQFQQQLMDRSRLLWRSNRFTESYGFIQKASEMGVGKDLLSKIGHHLQKPYFFGGLLAFVLLLFLFPLSIPIVRYNLQSEDLPNYGEYSAVGLFTLFLPVSVILLVYTRRLSNFFWDYSMLTDATRFLRGAGIVVGGVIAAGLLISLCYALQIGGWIFHLGRWIAGLIS